MSEWIGEGVSVREREREGWSKRVREGGREGASE